MRYNKMILIIIMSLFLCIQDAVASPASVKGVTKVYRNSRYIILINYETHDNETDGLLLRVHCKFDKGESLFTSNTLNNIKRGRHKTELVIPAGIRKEYGSLRSYSTSIYKNGILLDTKIY